jgi:predicted Zn-dependent peptidase
VELREKRGLAYEVSAFYPTRLEDSQFIAYIGTASQNTATALAGLRHECERLATVAITYEELQICQSKLLGQYALGKQTNSQIAQIYGWYEVMGLGLEFDRQFVEAIAAVTIADVQHVAQKYLTSPAISVVGSADALQQLA